MKFLCMIGLHDWEAYDWSSRKCNRCGHREILVYTADEGEATWTRVIGD